MGALVVVVVGAAVVVVVVVVGAAVAVVVVVGASVVVVVVVAAAVVAVVAAVSTGGMPEGPAAGRLPRMRATAAKTATHTAATVSHSHFLLQGVTRPSPLVIYALS